MLVVSMICFDGSGCFPSSSTTTKIHSGNNNKHYYTSTQYLKQSPVSRVGQAILGSMCNYDLVLAILGLHVHHYMSHGQNPLHTAQ